EIAKVTPQGVDKVQLYSSGAEAVESAFRLAMNNTGHQEVVGYWGGFHGKTARALSVNGSGNAKTYGPCRPDMCSRSPTATGVRSSSSIRAAASPAPIWRASSFGSRRRAAS